MLFNSIPFLLFIFLFFGLWPLAKKNETSKWLWICAMSFLFYGWWDWRFLFLLIGTGSIDYFCGRFILHSKNYKKFWLWTSIITNLGSLSIFKYSAWLASELNVLFKHLGMVTEFANSIPEFSLILPIGISFYTFNSLSYTIDLYRGKSEPAKNWLHFMAFISFFPHLVAGPIIKARDVLKQLNKDNPISFTKLYHGLTTCIWGFFQKMVLADNLAVFVNAKFENPYEIQDSLTWWICILAFAFQIYFDFNGYSTIARGIAKICGIHFRLNFNHPYHSTSFQSFWRRWHISLSTFFKDYVYISLGGNRKGFWRTEINRWITMLLSGLWHGANITFIVWGGLHALFLSLENLVKRIGIKKNALTSIMGFILVFIGVLVGWVFFRSHNLNEASFIIRTMFTSIKYTEVNDLFLSNVGIWLTIALILDYTQFYKLFLLRKKFWLVQVIVWVFTIFLIFFFRGPEQTFYYFQF